MGAVHQSLCRASVLLTILSLTASTAVLRGPYYDLNKSPNRKETKCIDSAEDLLQAYINKEHHNMVAGNQTIFKISQEVILRYAQIAIYYRTLPPLPQDNVTTTISNDACCDPITEEDCQVLITSRKSIYVYFPPHLVYTMVKVISVSNMYWDSKMNYGLVKGCWTPPTFCDDTNTVTILRDFSIKMLSYQFKDVEDDIHVPSILVVPRTWFSPTYHAGISFWVHMLFASMCLVSFPIILYMVKTIIRDKDRKKALSGSPISQALYSAVCLSSWLFFVILYVTLFGRLSVYKNKISSHDEMPEIFMSFVTVGYNVLFALGGIFFMELLFMMWYISQKVLKTKALFTTRSRSCLLCCKKQTAAMGLAGVVLFLQILAGCFTYFLTLVTVNPLEAVAVLCQSGLLMALVTLLIALLIIPCTTACRRCPRGSCKLALSVLVAVMALIFYIILIITVPDNTTASFDAGRITTSLLSSALLAFVGYSIRLLLFRQAPQERELVSQCEEIKD